MALHELATGAAKHGALRQPDGHLAIAWRESGVVLPPAGSTPTGSEPGRELIERALPYQPKARTHYTSGADGVHCTISIPVSASA